MGGCSGAAVRPGRSCRSRDPHAQVEPHRCNATRPHRRRGAQPLSAAGAQEGRGTSTPPFPLPAHPLGLSPSHLSSHSHSHSHTHTHTHANRHRAATLSISCPPSPSPLSHAVGRVSRGRGLRIALPRDKQRPAGSPRRWSLVDHPLPTLYLLVVLNTRHAHRIHLCKSIWTSYACMGAGVRGRQARRHVDQGGGREHHRRRAQVRTPHAHRTHTARTPHAHCTHTARTCTCMHVQMRMPCT